jgi:hypothetical protein
LLVIPLFTDIKEHAGGTMICSDGIKKMAQHLVRSTGLAFLIYPCQFANLTWRIVQSSGRCLPIHGSSRPAR